MDINVVMPFDDVDHADEFITAEAVAVIAKHVESLGYSGVNVTDHPIPTARWRDSGGHDAQDPFVMLALIAAHTQRVRLQTGILVVPYRNPFVTARAAATLDVFSGGRVTLGLGAGYLKGEYFALGVDFEQRNELMDDYIKAMKLAWTGETFDYEGIGYSARGNRQRPAPVQKNGIPLLVGGNSRRAIRRAVELGDAWYPFFTPKLSTSTVRSASFEDEDDLRAGLAYLRDYSEKMGRETPPDIVLTSMASGNVGSSPQELLDVISRYRELGVVGTAVGWAVASRSQWCDQAQWFAEEVLHKIAP